MPTLQDVVQKHLASHDISIRSLAQESGITYPTLLGVVNRGSVPRRPEHREALRAALGMEPRAFTEVLIASGADGFSPAGGPVQTLQQLINHKVLTLGLTEQRLAEQAGVAYSTVMGITRKGSIPREDSLNRLVDALLLDPDDVRAAVAASRALRRSGLDQEGADDAASSDEVGLAVLVGRHMRSRGQSMGSFAKDLGIGYFRISRFLDTGIPFEDPAHLESLRHMLGLDRAHFDAALAISRRDPRPADLSADGEFSGSDGNPLQRAIVDYMRNHNLTLKALAKRADLSQVTVSRLVKQGQAPSRATTHIKLQDLLGLDPDSYQALVARTPQTGAALLSKGAADDEEDDDTNAPSDEDSDDGYHPQPVRGRPTEPVSVEDPPEGVPTKDELVALVKRLGPKQREALKTFLAAMV